MANIFFLADSLPVGGVTTYLRTIAGALAARGHAVTVLINEGAPPAGIWPDAVTLQVLPVRNHHTRASLTGQLRKILLRQKAEWVFFNNCYYMDSYALRGTAICGVYVVHANGEEETGH